MKMENLLLHIIETTVGRVLFNDTGSTSGRLHKSGTYKKIVKRYYW